MGIEGGNEERVDRVLAVSSEEKRGLVWEDDEDFWQHLTILDLPPC